MNYLRVASIIGLVMGVGMVIAGYQLSQETYGCVPPTNATCALEMPPPSASAWFWIQWGVVVSLVSLAILNYSFLRRHTNRHLVAGGFGVFLGCALTYLASLIGWSPGGVGGFMQWGVPLPWHDVATGNGEPTIGPYHYVNLFNLGLDLIFWSILAAIVVETLVAVQSSRARVVESGSLVQQANPGKATALQGLGHG